MQVLMENVGKMLILKLLLGLKLLLDKTVGEGGVNHTVSQNTAENTLLQFCFIRLHV